MNRLTVLTDGKYYVSNISEAIERLAAYENMRENIEKEQINIAAQLQELRSAGKEKTVKFRELFAQKLQNTLILNQYISYKLS